MKKILFAILTTGILASCGSENKDKISTDDIRINASAEGNKGSGNLPAMEFTEETHDFGRITQGEKVSYNFHFKNTGNSNLIISSAQASCGCTVAEPPKEPIAPGKEGQIGVVFNSDGKSGKIDKKITVLTNCEPNTRILTITADIIVPTESNPNTTISK
ncbi:MAG: DUF1573 domain-containing protein [Bacteroidia bacterium]